MKDADKTKKQLICELEELRQRNIELETLVAEPSNSDKVQQESLQKYQALFNASMDAIFWQTLEGKVLNCNASACEMFGYTKEELVGLTVADLVPEEIAKTKPNMINEQLTTDGMFYEAVNKRKDGSVFPVEVSTRLVTVSGKRLVIACVRNITERRRALEALRHSEEKYRNLIENSNDAIYLLHEGKFEVINERFEEMLGVTQDEVRAPDFNFMQLVAPKSKELVMERARMLARGKEPTHRYEFTALTKNGKEVEVEVSVSYVSYRGGQATQGILRDVSHRKQLEAQLRQAQKMEAIGTLAGGIAHDFNNLLTGISGYTQLALSKLSPQHPLFADLERVEQAASRAATLTRQILAFSRKQVLEMRPINLNKVVEDLTRLLRRIIGEHIELLTVLEEDIPSIMADPTAIEQVLTNLLVNARDAMPDGGELLIESGIVVLDEEYCEQHPWATQGEHVMLLVNDTGVGMDQETQAHIFEPFFTTKETGEGTGLGLAMAYGLIKQHDGFIHVYSEPECGTAFKIYFPAIGEEADKGPTVTREESSVGGNETILVAEDEESVRIFITELLQQYGYTVLAETNGADALEVFEKSKTEIHLVILDAVMPLMGGREVYEIVKEKSHKTKFLFISGYSANIMQQRFVLDHGLALLKKPFSPNQLLEKVREILDGKR